MGTPAEQLGASLASASGGSADRTVSAQVVDVTDDGRVNISIGGTLVLDVPCADSYAGRKAGDWTAVRITGGQPVVMWRLGEDPGSLTDEHITDLATGVALDLQVVRAVSWGTADPSGTGWQQTTVPYARKVDGKVELYLKIVTQTDPPPPPPPARAPSPVTISPTDSGSWQGGRPADWRGDPSQGDWTGSGNYRGAWFYGTAVAAACSGKTVSSMAVTLSRKRGSGVNASRPVHLYLHSYTSAPSGQLSLGDGPEEVMSLSVGATRTANLPSSWRSALASGSARGLAVYASGSRDYMALTGGKIKITFSA